jgi:dihydrofolate reductase
MEAIYAIDSKNGISKEGRIPWHSKKDLKFFMNMTKNNIVIMGRKTYFSLPKRPLSDRLNIILTNNPLNYSFEENKDLIIFSNDEKIHKSILNNRENLIKKYPFLSSNFKIFIIGGKDIYEKYILLCETVWVTRLKKDYSCDLFFNFDYSKEFKEELVEEDDELKIIKYKKNT